MASQQKQSKFQTVGVVCKCCGKEIQPSANGIVTNYVWRDGDNLCFECNKKMAKGSRQ